MLKIKTVQAAAFKTAFEVLKDILNDVNIIFDPQGIKMTTLDTAKVALVDMTMDSEKFEEYSYTYDSEKVITGINVTNLFKLLKTITSNDTLTMEISDTDHLHIKIENTSKKSTTSFTLKLLDINEDILELPDLDMSVTTTLQSIDFQRICRDMSNIGQDVVISREDDRIYIECNGDFASQKTEIETGSEIEGFYSGKYSLKYLNLFTKATSMCSLVQILQEENNRFLLLNYNVANLGTLSFYLATKSEE